MRICLYGKKVHLPIAYIKKITYLCSVLKVKATMIATKSNAVKAAEKAYGKGTMCITIDAYYWGKYLGNYEDIKTLLEEYPLLNKWDFDLFYVAEWIMGDKSVIMATDSAKEKCYKKIIERLA